MFKNKLDFELIEYKKAKNKLSLKIKGIEKGLGAILALSLRRILYRKINSPAFFSIKIKGIKHEFSSIPGLFESFFQFTSNLRKIALRSLLPFEETEASRVSIAVCKIEKKSSPKEQKIFARDLVCTPNVQIANPDQYLGLLAPDKNFEAEIRVNLGYGFISWSDNVSLLEKTGEIALDTNYSPIVNCYYLVKQSVIGSQEETIDNSSKEDEFQKNSDEFVAEEDIQKAFAEGIFSQQNVKAEGEEEVIFTLQTNGSFSAPECLGLALKEWGDTYNQLSIWIEETFK